MVTGPFRPPEISPSVANSIRNESFGHPTPFVLWDVGGLVRHVRAFAGRLRDVGIDLSIGLKATNVTEIVSLIRREVDMADAQSPGEVVFAQASGFTEITASGPSFIGADLERVISSRVLLDVDSFDQLEAVSKMGVNPGQLGWRVRVNLPAELRAADKIAEESRFGIVPSDGAIARIRSAGQLLGRMRLHTGEALSRDVGESLAYRLRLGEGLSAALGHSHDLNLGGGLLALARDPTRMVRALDRLAPLIVSARARGLVGRVWVEPGAALVIDHAFLIATVIAVDPDKRGITLDASPWNLAPWTFPRVYILSENGDAREWVGDVFGPALYEGDRFRTPRHREDLLVSPLPVIGSRVLVTSFGAYTSVHERAFGFLPRPEQRLVNRTIETEIGCEDDR